MRKSGGSNEFGFGLAHFNISNSMVFQRALNKGLGIHSGRLNMVGRKAISVMDNKQN
jgi:hypothetical protein